MGKRSTYRQYAPYLYLARPEGEGCYQLFVAIRKGVDEEVEVVPGDSGQAVRHEGGLTTIAFSLTAAPGATDEGSSGFFLRRFELAPAADGLSGLGAEAPEVEVSVSVKKEGADEQIAAYENSMAYVDADIRPVLAEELDSELAFNCPYIYLEPKAPSAEEARENTFLPFMLLALKGYRLGDGTDKIIATSPGNGVFESIVALSKGDDGPADERFQPFADPEKLEVNGKEYSDSGQGEGNFAVTLVFRDSESDAEAFRNQEPIAMHRSLVEMEHSNGAGQQAGASGATLRKAKTRNMSSRRKGSRSIHIGPPA